MKSVHRDIVSAIIVSDDNKILMGMKDSKKGGVYSECWHIPGGGLEAGESKEEALKREIYEEVGIDITDCKVRLIDDKGSDSAEKHDTKTGDKVLVHMKFFVYEVRIDKISNDISLLLNDDLYKAEWFPIDRMSSVTLTPPSVALFRRLGYTRSK